MSDSDSNNTDATAGPTNSNTNTDSNTDSDTNSNTDTDTNSNSDTDGGDLWCADNDNDGYGDGEDCVAVPPGEDPPGGSVNNGEDCDDDDENTHPGAAENEPELCTIDADDDGYGDSDPPDGVDPGNDCNDNDELVFEDCLCAPELSDNEDPICVTPQWGYQLLDLLVDDDDDEWVFNNEETEVCEPSNGPATALVCDGWELGEDGKGNVRFRINSEEDNDWIGFVFGWQDFGHFYSFTWKKGPQLIELGNLDCLEVGTFKAGMMVKSVDAFIEGDVNCRDMHEDADTLHSELLWDPGDSPDTNVPWQENTNYMFSLDMSVDAGFIITITNTDTDETVAVIQSDDMKYPDGQMGLFSASQKETCFSGFATTVCE